MHHPRSAASAFLLAFIASLTVAVGGESPASAAVGPNTTWTMRGDPGDPVLGQQTYSYDAGAGIEFDGSASQIEGTVDGWTLLVGPLAGDVLQAGRTYSDASAAPSTTQPQLRLSGVGKSCFPATGNFTVHELTFDTAGQVESVILTFQQYCEGKKGPAQGSIAWHASRPAPALAPIIPQLRLKVTPAGRRPFPYGTVVTAVATLYGNPQNRELSLYVRLHRGPERLVAQGVADANGLFTVPVTVEETSTIIVRLDGQGVDPDLEETHLVNAEAALLAGPTGKPRKRGRTYLYRPSADPVIAAVLRPNHVGDCIRFRSEVRIRRSWRTGGATPCIRLNKRSAGAVRYGGDVRLVGIPIRVRAEWKGDERNPRARSKWVYLKFVR